jgi:predicted GNAT family acetyltransferase
MDAPVRHDEAASRFEVETPDGPAFAEYQRARGLVVFTHTGVPEAQEGHGIGSRLQEGEPVMPLCPFIAAYIREHPAYRDLVMPGFRL